MGRTECNRIVNFDGGPHGTRLVGQMIDVHITQALPHSLRGEVQAELNALVDGRKAPVELAQAWLGDDHAALRLRFAAELALDGISARLAGTPAPGLTLPGDFQKLSAWFDAANRLRNQLRLPALRHDLALAGLLLEWRSMFKDTASMGARR